LPILITAGDSFVGSHLLRYLADLQVPSVATFRGTLSGKPKFTVNSPYVEYVRLDLTDASQLKKISREWAGVVHLATRQRDEKTNTTRYISDHVVATQLLLETLHEYRQSSFTTVSTISVHGDDHVGPITKDTPADASHPYGQTKRMAEQVIENTWAGTASFCLRAPAIVGPGSRNNWPTRIQEKAGSGMPISIYNPTSLFNGVISVSDLCQFITKLLFSRDASGHYAFPIASTNPISIRDVVKTTIKAMASESVIREETETTTAPPRTIDDSYARAYWGYDSRCTRLAIREAAEQSVRVET
jgi:nucleoside-diphosphate-sugar epimerase